MLLVVVHGVLEKCLDLVNWQLLATSAVLGKTNALQAREGTSLRRPLDNRGL